MITQQIDNLILPKSIVEYAREAGLTNLAENHSYLGCSKALEDLLLKHILPNANYSPEEYGLMELRKAISAKTSRLYDYDYNPLEEVTITAGVKQSVFASILALLKEGDEVIIFEPAHKSYDSAIKITGARAIYVALKGPDFKVDWEDVQKVITSHTRMIIINSPHFPTGSVLSELDMIRLQKIINGTKIIILSDESFEHVVFDGEMHQSIALYPALRERSVIISSFNETLNIPHWHIGYCMATEKLMCEIRKVLAIVGEGINLPYQMAVAEHLLHDFNYNSQSTFYQNKRDLFLKVIEDSNIKAVPSKGTYFQIISVKNATEKNDVELAQRLMRENMLATIPISAYYHENSKKKFLRLNLSVPDEVIMDAATKLKSL